ncbi:MAG TPA: hypothetical protein VNT26_17075, partial [Candidatus Sulfotelmatobacter sp.]|nr:hypothetical protein [Candidatus Sulfotelmatobacter sp.]
MSSVKCPADCHLNLSWPGRASAPAPEGSPEALTWLSGGIAVLTPEGTILSANDALATWLESSPARLQGQALPKLLGQRYPAWGTALQGFLQNAAGFDRLELAITNQGRSEKLNLECCCHEGVRFLRLESVVPPVAEFEDLFAQDCWGQLISQQAFQRMLRSEAQLENLMNRWPGIIF